MTDKITVFENNSLIKQNFGTVFAGEMVAIRREKRVEHIGAPDVVGEVAILSTCLPELATRYAAASLDHH